MGVEEIDFNEEFSADGEAESAMDSLVIALGEAVAEDESRMSIINPMKLRQISLAYKVLKYIMRGTDAKVTYQLHQPFHSTGFVSVVGKEIRFQHPTWMVKLAELASNVEVYPLTGGNVRLNYTFHGLTRPIE